jgi:hypothetical protein
VLSQDERNVLGKEITRCALIYGKDLGRGEITMMITLLEEYFGLTCSEYVKNIRAYIENPANKFFPTLVNLGRRPELSAAAKANDLAGKIRKAITVKGWADPEGAKEYLGPVGWEVVERSGGWVYICENHGVDLNPLTFHAQARDMALSLIETEKITKHEQIESRVFNLDFKLKTIEEATERKGIEDGRKNTHTDSSGPQES